jgi:hypothetical protein
MTTTYFTTTTITAISNTVNDDVLILSGVLVGATEHSAFLATASTITFTIDGHAAGNISGIVTNYGISNTNITVGSTGTVTGHFYAGVFFNGANDSIDNFGEIRGGAAGVVVATTGTASTI